MHQNPLVKLPASVHEPVSVTVVLLQVTLVDEHASQYSLVQPLVLLKKKA